MEISDELDDAAVIDAFVAYQAENRHSGIKVDARPDVDNRNSSDIDAIAGPLAIEHTSIDSVENQRRNSAWFGEIAIPLEARFRDKLPFRLRLVFPYEGVKVGQNWPAILAAFERWVVTVAQGLPDGPQLVTIEGVPFQLRITKAASSRPGLYCMRSWPDDTTLAERLSVQVRRKAKKLKPYRAAGKTTVLLLDSGDIALMSVDALVDAIRTAFPSGVVEGVDELWHADTSIPSELEFWDLNEMLVTS